MIDAKKITEAAIQNADKYNPGRSTLDREEVCRASFKDGVEWLKQAIWHDAKEEPEEHSEILYIVTLDGEIVDNGVTVTDLYSIIPWREVVSRYCICKWCYLEDILPKGGDK